ncbi:MAG TPA: bifunctional glutamate N-acetyltransferase/amino-acid acetyltransferase ArgJ [Abditibacteriaceae bacterium]|nr:bifunctional glutamate N-acetyltransferase/amino-acid acetyltransferase ArgJ [Abditibacteriaceae bacterium]
MANQLLPHGGIVTPQGFIAGAVRGGIKTEGDDVALIVSETSATAAAVFTRNMVKAAPVLVCAEHAQHGIARAIVVNAGNANCCTGEQGVLNARRMCELAAAKIGCEPREVLVCSTGIIGHQLPMEKVETAIAAIDLSGDAAVNEIIARAVMTTDTRPKFCAAQAVIEGRTVTVGGQVKGVGMIGPDMGPLAAQATVPHATLLAFLTTDAAVERSTLQRALESAVAKSFNSVTVDGDTSTNDTCLLLANGASGVLIEQRNYDEFCALLDVVCTQLAKMVAADGEGATKLVTVEVSGAPTQDAAKRIALTVANSPLVKTAIFGRDPNWGRIAAAAGRAGVAFDAHQLSIRLGGLEVFHNGEPTEFSVADAEAAMQGDELTIGISLGAGEANWTAWTCDFSYDYVKINAEYHT